MTPAEKYRLLIEWNDTAAEYPSDKSVPELFEIQARQTPDALAVISDDRRLTYRELDARSNQLARFLVRHGVIAGSAVALCMQRSVDVVTALLAILKAGAVYVPLDPQYPRNRLAFMFDDCQAKVALTQQATQDRLPCARQPFEHVVGASCRKHRRSAEAVLCQGPRGRVSWRERA